MHWEELSADGEGLPLDRLKALRDLGVEYWYLVVRRSSDTLSRRWAARARALARIKDDQETKRLQDEFFAKDLQH